MNIQAREFVRFFRFLKERGFGPRLRKVRPLIESRATRGKQHQTCSLHTHVCTHIHTYARVHDHVRARASGNMRACACPRAAHCNGPSKSLLAARRMRLASASLSESDKSDEGLALSGSTAKYVNRHANGHAHRHAYRQAHKKMPKHTAYGTELSNISVLKTTLLPVPPRKKREQHQRSHVRAVSASPWIASRVARAWHRPRPVLKSSRF